MNFRLSQEEVYICSSENRSYHRLSESTGNVPYYIEVVGDNFKSSPSSSEDRVRYELMAAQQDEWAGWSNFLYLADIQENRQELLYVDKVHYTASFNREIAELIGEKLISGGFSLEDS